MSEECTCGKCGVRSGKKISLSGERTSTLYLNNPMQRDANCLQVDGCQIKSGKRCDWLVCINDKNGCEEIYVELKGKHVPEAIEQLETTLKRLRCACRSKIPVCIVVMTRNPLSGTDMNNEKKRFKERYQAKLLTIRDGAEYNI